MESFQDTSWLRLFLKEERHELKESEISEVETHKMVD